MLGASSSFRLMILPHINPVLLAAIVAPGKACFRDATTNGAPSRFDFLLLPSSVAADLFVVVHAIDTVSHPVSLSW
jgi:hypothetical protein